jgi:hypothetical protein
MTKLEANRRNAQKSTGPRTAEGKALAARNATRHGLLSTEALLPDDDLAIFEAFAGALRAELAPGGELEGLMVDRVVACAWRLRRAGTVEAGAFIRNGRKDLAAMLEDDGVVASRPADLAAAYVRGRDTLALLSRYEAGLERSMFKALHELQRLQAARNGEAVPLPVAVDVDLAVSGASAEG